MQTQENTPPPVPGIATPWHATRVAAAYQGVWARTLLETPAGRDTTTWVRWAQTAQWHGSFGRSGESSSVCEEGPDAPHHVFQTPDRIVQTGIHDRHLAVWERLPGSAGPRIALARRDALGRPTPERLLQCGQHLLYGLPRHDGSHALAYGLLDRKGWHIEQASEPSLIGTTVAWRPQRLGLDLAQIAGVPWLDGAWEVLEWTQD